MGNLVHMELLEDTIKKRNEFYREDQWTFDFFLS